MASGKAHINGEMLEWARREAGMSIQSAAQTAGITNTKKNTCEDRIRMWETGEEFPSKNQLTSLAKAYVQPTLLFYLASPPAEDEVLPDFRKLSPDDQGLTPRLKSLVARTRARQEEVIEILTDDEDAELPDLPFLGRFDINTPVDEFVADLRVSLGVTEAQQRRLRDNDALFRLLRNAAETLGVYVIIQGDLGHHTTRIDASEFRGFCIADPIAPFIIINNYDAKPAQTFSLMHELAHLWINESGLSNASPFVDSSVDAHIENYCNKVASHFLMPPNSLLSFWRSQQGLDNYRRIGVVASEFSVSRRAVAYRLRMENELTFLEWQAVTAVFKRDFERSQAKQKAKKGGLSPFLVQKYRLGGRFIGTVLGALDSGVLGYMSASRILGVPSKGFSKIRPEGL